MVSREEYTKCMVPHMKGGGPDRKLRFCIGAKLCSMKSETEEEAEKLCIEAAANPKPAKATRRKGKAGFGDLNALAACAVQKIDLDSLTPENIAATLTAALQDCSGIKAPSYKRFMTACMKEIGTGDFLTSQGDIKKCQSRWNESRVS